MDAFDIAGAMSHPWMEDSNTFIGSASAPIQNNESFFEGNRNHMLEDQDVEVNNADNISVGINEDVRDGLSKRKRRLTSCVWGHFDILPVTADGKRRCKCKKCGAAYLCDSKFGTGNLKRHMQNCKKRDTRDIGQLILQSNSNSSISMNDAKFNQQEFRDLFSACIIMHDMPFQCVEWVGLRALLRYLRPDVQLISRNTARNDCKKMFIREKVQIQALLHKSSSRVSLTSDLWTSINTDGFMCLTAHYIDNGWRLQKKIINFEYMPPPQLFSNYSQSSIRPSFSSTSLATRNYQIVEGLSSSVSTSQFLQDFDSFEDEDCYPKKSELELYLDEPRLDRKMELDILHYWRGNQYRFPEVAAMARDVLSIPISTVASESAFSNSGRILDQYRSALKHDIVEALICVKDWLYGEQDVVDPELELVMEDVMKVNITNNVMEDADGSTTRSTINETMRKI